MGHRFSRSTIIAACKAIAAAGDSELEELALRLDVLHALKYKRMELSTEALRLAAYIIDDPNEVAPALEDEAVEASLGWRFIDGGNQIMRALERDGFGVTEDGKLRPQMPKIADLHEAGDEVHALLDELKLKTAKGHLDSAIENHASGDWPAANGQLRTVVESILDEIAFRLVPSAPKDADKAKERRELLLTGVDPPFLRADLHEWHKDKQSFLGGLFKRLNTEGSHPGLSGEEECTLRLRLVLVVAWHLLRRAKERLAS